MEPKKIGAVAGASIAAFAIGATLAGGIAIATADDNGNATTNNAAGQGFGPMGHHGPRGMHGTPASAEETQKATDAILAQYPGATVHMVTKEDDGFEAHFMTTDGVRKEAYLDANFAITKVEDDHGRGPGMHGTPASAEETQKVTDAILAQYPGATVHMVMKEDDGTFEAHFMTTDGVRKEAYLDANFAITKVEDDHGPGGPGMHGTPASAEETQKVTDAILAEYPGATVHMVMKEDDGTFEAHFMTADGKRKHAHLDADFKITDVRDARGPRGGHGPMGKDVTGAAFRKASKSAKAEVNGTVMGVHKSGKKYLVTMHKKNGTGVLVKENQNFKVLSTKKLSSTMGWHPGV